MKILDQHNTIFSTAKVILAFLTVLIISDAASAQDSVPYEDEAYQILPGDILEISVWKEPDLQRSVLVRPDGRISFPLAGEIMAAGNTVATLRASIISQLTKYIPVPEVLVTVEDIQGNQIYVLGQVNDPGVFTVKTQVDVMQALSLAGGTTAFAALNDVVILRRKGTQRRSISFKYSDVVRGRDLSQNIILQSGDVVVVP